MQQGRVGPWRRGRNPPRDCFDAGSSHDAGWRSAVFGSGGRVDRRNHFRFARGLERGRRGLARGAETGGTARGFQRLRVRHREAKRHDERQAECEARAFANHGSIIHPPSAHVQLEVPARRLHPNAVVPGGPSKPIHLSGNAKPPNDPNQAADRASCGAISGDIGSAGGGTGLFPSTPSLDQNEHRQPAGIISKPLPTRQNLFPDNRRSARCR